MSKIVIIPNVSLTKEQLEADKSFSSETFGAIRAIKQEIIAKYFKPVKRKQKIVIKVRAK